MDWNRVKQEYETSSTTLKSLAEKYQVKATTLRSRKNREHWQRATKKVATRRNNVATQISDELEANSELNEKQKLFCLFYLQRFNATWAYQQAYKVSHEVALRAGPRLLGNVGVKRQLTELKNQQRADLYVTADDIAHEYAKQAFASLGDVLDYKVHEELVVDTDGNVFLDTDDNPVKKHVADIYLKPSDQIDWSLVQDIHRGKDGLVVKLYDKQKALDSLSKLIGADDDNVNEQRIRKLKADADIAEAKAKQISNTDETVRIVFNDNLTPDKEDNQGNENQS
ncbi:terminase small subunit [Lactiplantibacillus plantarum]|uniref:terminase small subunit n=1 Tax=Lactiplantibacillus plantarum TaxID=1590 RepID=UPI00146450F2|nr:terminase small subunit [Lactiplantibacillus plantarum]QJP84932.1 terminase small subunit [Lactiplantibacillus plantarum]QLQ51356.1 terminase small subunit [Lactiplantibacillus plantarum]WDQ20580.1 terminase small subunit [Lactiplantibacillus plantarum]